MRRRYTLHKQRKPDAKPSGAIVVDRLSETSDALHPDGNPILEGNVMKSSYSRKATTIALAVAGGGCGPVAAVRADEMQDLKVKIEALQTIRLLACASPSDDARRTVVQKIAQAHCLMSR